MTMKAVVIGTGAMGPEIAAALAAAGWSVAIAGRTPAGRDSAAATASKWADAVVVPALIDEGTFTDADLVVETIVEDLDTKHALLRRIEPWCHPKAIITTNTSSLTIGEVASPLMWPKRFAGFHFLKPAHLTGVVEIIPGPQTSKKTTAFLREVAKQMDKTPLIATKDVPGFIWNRIQFAVLRECLHMVDEGVASPAERMHGDHRDAEVQGGLDGAAHRVGDVVPLEVEEDGMTVRHQRAHEAAPRPRHQHRPHLDRTAIRQEIEQRHRRGSVRKIQRHKELSHRAAPVL